MNTTKTKFETGVNKSKEIKFAWLPVLVKYKTRKDESKDPFSVKNVETKIVWLESYKVKKEFYPNSSNWITSNWALY